jgi:hypothetical protein
MDMPEIPTEDLKKDLKMAVLVLSVTYLIPIFLFALYVGSDVVGPLFSPTKLYPTYEELDRRGYYAYVIPPSIMEQYKWQEETFIWSWSRHCNPDSQSQMNPLTITYFDDRDERVFRIEISPWGIIDWAPFQPTVAIPFDLPWAKADTLEMFEREYQNKKFLYLRYEDWYGTPVYVVSQLPLTDTLTLLYSLNYVGAPPERAEPWERCDYW